jgi:riboflavin kinase/FMN adenylyltransferase
MSNEKKAEILKEEKVDILCFKDFDETFMKLTPKEFIQLLVEKYNVKGIIVGFNYKFGYRNLGNIKLLEELKDLFNYKLYIMDKCLYKNDIISSTRIRNAILEGNFIEATEMLTRPYSLCGEVVHGRKIGRTIGFPTANLSINKNYILPKIGVYYTNIKVNNNVYKGITSVGNNPTVNGKKLTVETYILDFNEDIYGNFIEVSFIKKIRDEKKFNGLEELKNELEQDKNFARNEKLYI